MSTSSEAIPLSLDTPTAFHRGCYQITFSPSQLQSGRPTPLPIHVSYMTPSGVRVAAKGFANAEGGFAARAYLTETGLWRWEAKSSAGKGIASGSFEVLPSELPGRLEISRLDSRQFVYANGSPYLHIADTAYRLLAPGEKRWQAYIDQAAQAGFTKIKVWLPSKSDDCSNFYDPLRKDLNLPFWDEVEKRLVYALQRNPAIQFQLILFAEDRAELERYEEGDALTHLAAQYAFERLGSLPNAHWSLATGIDPARDSAVTLQALSRLGKFALEQSPWRALITCGQARFTPFLFDREPWCGYASLSSLGQVTGATAQEHRPLTTKPIVADQDRAEHAQAPLLPRYYFRRLFWGLLLSGAHPTYEGLDTSGIGVGHKSGLFGYYDACHAGRLQAGAHDLLHIRNFFRSLGITLENWIPDDSIGGNNPLLVKSMRSPASDRCILYIANPDAHEGHSGTKGGGFYSDQNAAASDIFTTFSMDLPFGSGKARWFRPSTGEWGGEVEITKNSTTFLTPEPGDWVLYAQRS